MTCRCGRGAPTPMRRATPCSRCSWRRGESPGRRRCTRARAGTSTPLRDVPLNWRRWEAAARRSRIAECSIKRFPLGQYSQTIAQAALDVRGAGAGWDRAGGCGGGEHRDAADGGEHHGQRPGEVASGEPGDGRSLHAVHGGGGAALRRGGEPAFRRRVPVSTRRCWSWWAR